jgi:hypothetical protein
MNPLPELLPGDTLVYGIADALDCLIAVKTWSSACHVEVYAGGGMSMASRNGKGVGLYCFRKKQLIAVRRPNLTFDFGKGSKWFWDNALGQKYDWLGLLCFTLAVKQGSPNKMFCSEFWKNFFHETGLDVMAPDWPADKTAPAQCLQTPVLTTIWPKSVV